MRAASPFWLGEGEWTSRRTLPAEASAGGPSDRDAVAGVATADARAEAQ